MWNPLQALKDRFGKKAGGHAPEAPVPADMAEAAAAATAAGAMPDMKELEKKGLLRQFFRHWKDPAFLRQLQAISKRMEADGVNIKDQAAVKTWVEKHQADIAAGKFTQEALAEKPKTVVKTGPDIGRNDPCHCGSGKKYKKCHGAQK